MDEKRYLQKQAKKEEKRLKKVCVPVSIEARALRRAKELEAEDSDLLDEKALSKDDSWFKKTSDYLGKKLFSKGWNLSSDKKDSLKLKKIKKRK